jgi:hypothetical protein
MVIGNNHIGFLSVQQFRKQFCTGAGIRSYSLLI